jgi:hypothetical protein
MLPDLKAIIAVKLAQLLGHEAAHNLSPRDQRPQPIPSRQ